MIQINSNKLDTQRFQEELEKKIQIYEKKKKKEEILKQKQVYTIPDFTRYNGEEFIREIYRIILKKEVDQEKLKQHLEELASGNISKAELILTLRFSDEGKKYNVKILGIKKRYLVFQLSSLPFIGFFVRFAFALVRLPRLIKRVNALENYTEPNSLDAFYLAFENHFRGSREDIKERQEYYIPLVDKVMREKEDSVLDIGCGRGEWLELLKENQMDALGIDLNQSMVKESRSRGLKAQQMDALLYLQSLEDNSLTLISGFHIVEHLPFETLLAIFHESHRVLKSGGMILFETPNPENIKVGSCNFYIDPTHINPIPPVTLEFMAKYSSFVNVEIIRLHPEENLENIYGEATQDYSVIGYKA